MFEEIERLTRALCAEHGTSGCEGDVFKVAKKELGFCKEVCENELGGVVEFASWDEFEVKRIVQFKKDTWHEICFSLYPGIDEHNMDYFHPFTIVIITLEDGYYWADGLFMKSEDIVPVLEDYGIQFTERK